MESTVRNKKWDEEIFLNERKEVLSKWPTGKEVNIEEAVEYLKKVTDTDSALDYLKANSQYEMGEIYYKLNDLSRASYEYLKVAYLYPSHTKLVKSAYKQAAEILEKEGKLIQARNIYLKLLEFPEEKNFSENRIAQLNKKISGE